MADRSRYDYDLVVIGMGSGGMSAAEFAATMGVKTLVVEMHRVGGDCLWTGCVPSKALLAAAKVAHHIRTADRFGIEGTEPTIDRAKVWERVRGVRQIVADADDNADRYREMGLEVWVGQPGQLLDGHTLIVGDQRVRARFILLCTGSRPAVPPLPGLAEVGYLTSESIFELTDPPSSLVVIGGGPIGLELSQACRRLGMDVTVLQKGNRILPRDEPALVDALVAKIREEGVQFETDVGTLRARAEAGEKVIEATVNGERREFRAQEILVAAGRAPNVEGLGLDAARVKTGPRGILIDDRARTNVASIYAAGDVAGRFLFTHSAGYEAVRSVRDMFFPGKGTFSALIPWCTFTDPELAHAGQTIEEARNAHGEDAQVWELPLDHSDRARADGAAEGRIILVTGKKGRLVGAQILAPSAGEMIHELAFAISEERKLADLASFVHVYPTLSTSIGQLAAEAIYEGAKRYRWLVKLATR